MQSIEKGSVLELQIDSLANSGDGVGRYNGQVIFVPHSCPEDLLKIKITFKKKTFFKGEILEVIEPGPSRIDPPCEYAGQCGGCDWQHVYYDQQLIEKEQGLRQTLQRLGKIDPILVKPIQASPKTLGYRNRIQLQHDKKGFFYNQKGSHHAVYVDKCLLAQDSINENWQNCFQSLKGKKGKVEIAVMDEDIELFKVDDKGNSDLGFRQINDEQNQYLINKTLKVVESLNAKRVVDLYCGQGNWSIAIHRKFPDVHCLGIESNPISVGKAQDKVEPNLEFMLGKVETLYSFIDEAIDLVIIDPPRAGCSPEMLEALSNNPPKNMVYISCHPGTLARDLKYLTEKSWKIDEITPVDMFPQTSHLESWCLLHSDS